MNDSIPEQSEWNRKAWNHRAYEFWVKYSGLPEEAARDMRANPRRWLHRFENYIADVKGKKILVPLGSNGRKAIPLSILGARATIIDIAEENRRWAVETARAAGTPLDYIVADFMTYENVSFHEHFDMILAEGGILHYITDLDPFFTKLHRFLKPGGELVLNDFHPLRKYVKFDGQGKPFLDGDYFESAFHKGPVAYEDNFPEAERKDFPQCLLRFWTLAEIISAIARSGLFITSFQEGKNRGDPRLPGDFTILARKL
jgi:SAM-dependent methyltransferase